jgi:hypothetical protein
MYGKTKFVDNLKMADIKYSFSIFPNMKQWYRGSMNDHQEVLNSWNRVGRQHFSVIWLVHGEVQRGQIPYHCYLACPWGGTERTDTIRLLFDLSMGRYREDRYHITVIWLVHGEVQRGQIP